MEQRKQPDLRGLPTAVVQYNAWKGGALIAVSYEARKCGVKRYNSVLVTTSSAFFYKQKSFFVSSLQLRHDFQFDARF